MPEKSGHLMVKFFKSIVQRLARIVLPGFQGIPLGVVSAVLIRALMNTRLFDRSAAVTFFFSMAFPPTLLFLFTLIPYLPLHGVQDAILKALFFIVPNSATYNSIAAVLDKFLNRERTGLLSFGVLLAFYFSSNGMMSLMRAFDRSLPFYIERSGLKRRWTAIKLTVLVMLSFMATVVGLIIQSSAIDKYLLMITNQPILTKMVSLFIILLLVYFTISFIYRFGPSFEKKIQFFSPGSFFATATFVIITVGFFFLINNFIHYDVVYGPIGSLLAVMIWLYLLNMVLILGYEINVSILMSTHKDKRIYKRLSNEHHKPGDVIYNIFNAETHKELNPEATTKDEPTE